MTAWRFVAGAALVAGLCGAMNEGWAQPASAPSAQTPPPYTQPLPWVTRRIPGMLPPVPHEARPDTWPQPDYATAALAHTRVKPSDRGQAIDLRWPNHAPRLTHVVLPIQSQAFGFAPAFRALVAARLDHELAARGLVVNRQTDIADANGPYARRFSKETVAALAREHAGVELVALYLGNDGADQAFITLSVHSTNGEAGKQRQAHRTIDLPREARSAIEAVAAALPPLLAQVGLKGTTKDQPVVGAPRGCSAQAWQLEALDPRAPPALRACHALAVGSLLPAFDDNRQFASGDTPAKLAWLATAYTEARSLGRTEGSYRVIEDLAWTQLRLDDSRAAAMAHANVDDAVAGPVARLLTSRERNANRPVASARSVIRAELQSATEALPPLARAAFIERGLQYDAFHEVDLCAIERHLPGIMPRVPCRSDSASPKPASGVDNDLTRALHQEWRLAHYDKSLTYLGKTQGQRDALTRLQASLPADVSRHPLIRRTRYVIESQWPGEGNLDEQREHLHGIVQSFVQSTFDIQRHGSVMSGWSISGHSRPHNRHVWDDPRVVNLIDDEQRLVAVLERDRFDSWRFPTSRRKAGEPAAFLAPVPMRVAAQQQMLGEAPPAQPASAPPRADQQQMLTAAPPALPPNEPPRAGQGSPFYKFPTAPAPTEQQLREHIAARPTDMRARLDLAIRMLKQGQPLAKAVAIIDEQPVNQRRDEQVQESHRWANPAHAFYFAGELETARRYYQKVREIGTGSESDLLAAVRLRLIMGDLDGALQASDARLQRYRSDFVRRDVAAMYFMRAQPDRAWAVLQPRLLDATTFQLWQGAFVGHRMAGQDRNGVADWIDRQQLSKAQIKQLESPALYQHLHATTDRVPSEADIAALRASNSAGWLNLRWAASARLQRMALLDEFPGASFESLRRSLPLDLTPDSNFLQPLYAWAAWHATKNADPELPRLRATAITDQDFDELLSKAMLLALDGQHDEALQFLRAARWQMSELGLGHDNVERPIPSPYQYALSSYLLWRKTGRDAYRAEALDFARTYQRVFPFLSWTYALEAALSNDSASRAKAACRARHLDPGSYFLERMPTTKVAGKAVCGASLW